jgi:hypothetical protein
MRVKHRASKNIIMAKGKNANSATTWVRSAIKETEVEKSSDGRFHLRQGLHQVSQHRADPGAPEWLSGNVSYFSPLRPFSSRPRISSWASLYLWLQLHQLTPNSLLHIACFVTLCESFLGIEPHFLLWRSIFWLRPNVSLSRKPELGGAIVSVRPEA